MGIKTRSLCRLGRGILPVLAKVGAILGLRSSKTEDADDSSGRYPRGGQYRHGLKVERIGKGYFRNFVQAIEFSDTLIRLTAFQSFARMWTSLN